MEDRPEKKQKTSPSWREIWTGKRTGKNNNSSSSSSSSSSSKSSKDETKKEKKKTHKPAVMHVGWARWFNMTEFAERIAFVEMDAYLLAELGRVLREERIPVPGTSVNDPKRFEWKTEIVHQHYPIVVKNLNDLKFPQRERVYSEDRHRWVSRYPTRELAEFDLQWIKRKEDKKKKEEEKKKKTTAVLPKDGDVKEEEEEAKAIVLPEAKDMVDIKTPLIDLWLVEDHWMSQMESTEALRSQDNIRQALTKAISEGSKKVEVPEVYAQEPEWLLVDSQLHRAGRIFEVKNVWPPRSGAVDTLYWLKRDKEYDVVTEQASRHGFKPMFRCLRAPDPPRRADLAWDGTDPEYHQMFSSAKDAQQIKEVTDERKRRYDLYKPANDAFARMIYNCHPELQAQRLLLLSGDMRVKNREHGANVTIHGLPNDLLKYTKTFIMGKTDGKDTKEDDGGGDGKETKKDDDEGDGGERPTKKQKTSYRETVTVKRTGRVDRFPLRPLKQHKPAVMHIGYLAWNDNELIDKSTKDFLRLCEEELARALLKHGIRVPGGGDWITWTPEDVKKHYPIQIVTLDMMGLKSPQKTPGEKEYTFSVEQLSKFDEEWIRRKQETKSYAEGEVDAKTGEPTTRTETVKTSYGLKKPLLDLWYTPAISGFLTITLKEDDVNPRLDLKKARESQKQTITSDHRYDIVRLLIKDSPLGQAGRVFEEEARTSVKIKASQGFSLDADDLKSNHDYFFVGGRKAAKLFKPVFRLFTELNYADPDGPVFIKERAETHYDSKDPMFQSRQDGLRSALDLWYNTMKSANDAFSEALFDYHPELQAERLTLLRVERRVRDPGHGAMVNKPGVPLDILKYTKSFIMGKTEIKDERKPAPLLGTEPIMHIGIVTFDDKIRDDLAIDLLNNTLLTSALDERRKLDKDVPAGLRTRCYSLTGLGLNSPEFRFGKYSWQAKELQDFDATWIQKTKKPTREDHPPEIHAWVYATSIGGPGNSISKHKGEETHKVLASVKPSEYITSPPIQGGGADGNPFFAPAMVASMLLDSSFATEGRVFRLETALARKLVNQPDRLDPSRPIDLAHEIKETDVGAGQENTVVFIGQMSLLDNKFTGMNAGNKYTLIEKTARGNLSKRLNNMKTASNKKDGNAFLALQIHHAKVAQAMVRLHPGMTEYEASKFLRDEDLMDPGSRSIFKQFFGKASDFARRKADSVGDLVTETASLPVKVLEQSPGQFVKTTAALPLSATRVIVSGKANGNDDGDEGKHTCGWDTEDENIRQHLGPGYWDIIHRTTANVHVNERDLITARVFILWVAQNFPCESCRVKFSKSVSDPPIETVPKEKLFEHLVELHNQINRERGECEYPLERAKKRYKYTVE
jgi:hypothetical protein